MPVTGTVDNNDSIIAFHFTGTVLLDEIISAHQQISSQILTENNYLEINLFESDSRYHELSKERLEQLKEATKGIFEHQQFNRRKIASINRSKEAAILYPLWKAMVETDDEINSSYASFETIEEACNWLNIAPAKAEILLEQIGLDKSA